MLYHMDFPLLLKNAIKKRELSYAEFAEKVGASHGLPGAIISRQHRKTPTHIPDGKADLWADVLRLKEPARSHFLMVSAWHYASEDQKKIFRQLKERIDELTQMLAAARHGLNGGPIIAPKAPASDAIPPQTPA